MDNKIKMNLTGVPQTLLLPLFGRAFFSRRANSPLCDQRAMQLTEMLNYDFDKLSNNIGSFAPAWWVARAFHFDNAAKAFLQKYPQAVIVDLGAGLETGFYRIDNSQLIWVNLDLPEVIALREKLLPAEPRVYSISKSITDYTWMEDVKKLGEHFFFIGGGFFMYFTEAQVKDLFTKMAEYFPGGEIIFDSLSLRAIRNANKLVQSAQMKNAVLQWGMDDAKQLESWSAKIKLVEYFDYFRNLKTKYDFPLSMRLKMFLSDWFDKTGIIHLRFD